MQDSDSISKCDVGVNSASLPHGRQLQEPLRICLVVSSLRGGGTERVCVTIANGLASRGHAVQIVALNLHGARYQAALKSEIELVDLGMPTVRAAVPALWRFLARTSPSVVLAFNHQLAITCALARKMGLFSGAVVGRTANTLSQRMALTEGMWQRRVVPMLTRRLYRLCDRIVAQSQGMARDLMECFNLERTKIVTISNPLSIEMTGDVTASQRGLYSRTILFVGRLEEAKDPLFLIRSFATCLRGVPDLRLMVAGTGSLENAMRDAVRMHDIAGSVTFLGFQRDMASLYRGAAATVLCSRVEGMPNCLLESLACGTPVVSLDCPHGPAEIIVDGENGYLVRERAESLFAAAVLRAVNREWDRTRVCESVSRFSAVSIISEYEQLLVKVARTCTRRA